MSDEARVALVTGCARGIGAGTVRVLKAAGWHVAGCDVLAHGELDGSPVDEFYTVDLAKTVEIEAFYHTLSAKYGHLNALVNNAGVHWPVASLEDATVEQFDHITAVNMRAPWLMTKTLLPLLKAAGEHKASVVFVSSVAAVAAPADISIYTATKGAVNAITRQLAVELGWRHKIRVNAVMPGQTDTPLFRRHIGRLARAPDVPFGQQTPDWAEAIERLVHSWAADHSVLHRVGRPEDVGHAVAYLCDCERAAFVTGECMLVDGGLMAQLLRPK